MKNAPVLHRIEYGLFAGLRGLLGLLPHRSARRVGSALGDLLWVVLRDRRRVALSNLEHAFPELDSQRIRELALESFRHLGRTACDTVSSYRLDRENLCSRLTLQGWEHLDEARAAGQGVLVMGAHLGAWEMSPHPVGLYSEPIHLVGRPLDNPLLDRLLIQQRSRFGNYNIPKRGAARGSLRILRQGGVVGILIDQRVRPEEGIEVPFFGRPAVTSPILARLALKTGVPIVPIFGHLAPDGCYRVEAHPPIDTAFESDGSAEDTERAAAVITERCLQVVEREIRKSPAQWLWLHRRWKR